MKLNHSFLFFILSKVREMIETLYLSHVVAKVHGFGNSFHHLAPALQLKIQAYQVFLYLFEDSFALKFLPS
jgi:hypothetical protein